MTDREESSVEMLRKDLRGLVNAWRQEGELYLESEDESKRDRALQQMGCADDLESLLDEAFDDD